MSEADGKQHFLSAAWLDSYTSLKTEAACSSETWRISTRLYHIAEADGNLYSHLCKNLKSKSRYERRSVGQSVMVTRPRWGATPAFCYRQTVALSDERTGRPHWTLSWSAWNSLATTLNLSLREREREREKVRHYIGGGGKKLYFPSSARSSFW
jgi:hypothetical protein